MQSLGVKRVTYKLQGGCLLHESMVIRLPPGFKTFWEEGRNKFLDKGSVELARISPEEVV